MTLIDTATVIRVLLPVLFCLLGAWIIICIIFQYIQNQETRNQRLHNNHNNNNSRQTSSRSVRLTVEQVDKMLPAKPYKSVVLEMMKTGRIPSSNNNNNNNIAREIVAFSHNGTNENATNQSNISSSDTMLRQDHFGTSNFRDEYLDPFRVSCAWCCESFVESKSIVDLDITDIHQNNTEPEQEVRVLSCGHIFHDNCISDYILISGKFVCPLCRRKL